MESNFEESVVCEFCGRSFGRQEHLDRHVRSHLNHRPFQCDGCGQYFSRRYVSLEAVLSVFTVSSSYNLARDTRNRHATTSCPKTGRPRIRAYSNRATAACVSCSHSKLRCSTGNPCTRCHSKGISCVYRESKDTGGRSRVFRAPRASSTQSDPSIKNNDVADQRVISPQALQPTNLETQLVSSSAPRNGKRAFFYPGFGAQETQFGLSNPICQIQRQLPSHKPGIKWHLRKLSARRNNLAHFRSS